MEYPPTHDDYDDKRWNKKIMFFKKESKEEAHNGGHE